MPNPKLSAQPSVIRARAPLRLGLAGGGTDVSPYCDEHGGCVLNVSIDRYAYATLTPTADGQVHFAAADRQQQVSLPASPRLALNGELDLHKAVYNRMVADFNGGEPMALALTSYCDAPVGSGLGSSSTLVVAMVKAFMEHLNLPLDDYHLAALAFQIEREDCGLQGGRQDQYAATFGGFSFMEFYGGGRAVINSLRIKNWIACELEASLVLFDTGVSRESARIIADQSANVKGGHLDALEAMHRMKQEALQMKECLLKGDFDGIVASMQEGWANKKRSASKVSNPAIDTVFQAALAAGARAGKISGAGGGGFIMFYVDPARRMDVVRCLRSHGGQVSHAHFTHQGTQAWRL